jgi:hypothetical protein
MDQGDLVLVAVLNNRRDFEIARLLGWYRIPLKTAPRTVAVDWLAFYQTARFGDEKWAVNYVAPVRGHELTTRAELLRTEADHPRAAEQYYRIQIGALERLPHPVPSRAWRRVTFLYTTGEKLLAAAELNDLIVQSPERERLWAALRERGLRAERQYTHQPAGELDFALLCQLGNLGILMDESKQLKERRGWRYLRVTPPTAEAEASAAAEGIARAVNALGGLADAR